MASYNKIILLGNMTRDPQMSYLPSGTAAVEFGIATNRRWTSQDGQQREDVCFVDCRMYGRRAEVIQRYFKKGMPIFIEGHLVFDTWTAQDGSKRSRHRVQVEGFEFVGSQGGSQGQSPDQGYQQPPQQGGYSPNYGSSPAQYNQPPGSPANQQGYQSSPPQAPEETFDPDDIPF